MWLDVLIVDANVSLFLNLIIATMRVKIQGPAFAVHVSRPAEVEQTRKDFPIIMMEQEIMEAINYPATLLYEAGFGSKRFSSRSGVIGITQPRCVAVLATATRVAHELGVRLRRVVVFQVRHDKKIGKNSAIKFMTAGILLREIKNDLLLRCYSVIILDEAHERSLNTGFLLWMLTRTNNIRQEVYKDQQKFYNLEAQWHQKTKSSRRF
ncbi:unnamed protein product [Brassica oleracea var. botrytis]|uniref:RNA helicase n=2 Tax=Brassica oleracea TaxID=3712 RepID=A0A0D3DKT9_BRAOL|nr:unnamed protein product [Brassica oleracea]